MSDTSVSLTLSSEVECVWHEISITFTSVSVSSSRCKAISENQLSLRTVSAKDDGRLNAQMQLQNDVELLHPRRQRIAELCHSSPYNHTDLRCGIY